LGAIGLLVLVPAWLALVVLQRQPGGAWWVLYVFSLVWVADTGAYFAGKQFGRTKLAPKVSPGKSVEGLVGGLLATLMLALGVATQTDMAGNVGVAVFVAVSMFTVLASVQGDLFESMIKRQRGIKDSSQILPGHGGLLDRIDSVTAAAPVFVACMFWLGGLH
jgi:phosphatidate cytidylyltransferase